MTAKWLLLLGSALTPLVAQGQWITIHLHPPGFLRSEVLAVTPSMQGGNLHDSESRLHSALWAGTATSWSGLAPSGSVYGMQGDRQVGRAVIGSGHASLWFGTPESRIDLHPATGAIGSEAAAISGNQQVGNFTPPVGGAHAALWFGSAASMVDLHPAGMASSRALATDGALQGGRFALPSGTRHAALWAGSAASFINMNPTGAISSAIEGMVPGEQVGFANFGSGNRAMLWRGTPQSAISLHPEGVAGVSGLYATVGSAQVGWANTYQYGLTAGIWFGTAESFIPLAPYLPPGYGSSSATSIAELNGTYYIGGYAYRIGTLDREAFLWVGQVPAPGAGAVLLGAGVLSMKRRRLTAPDRRSR
jgi:hypothetical protein